MVDLVIIPHNSISHNVYGLETSMCKLATWEYSHRGPCMISQLEERESERERKKKLREINQDVRTLHITFS